MENNFLLPCPFCGFEKPCLTTNKTSKTVSVVCVCGASSKPVLIEIRDSVQVAVDFWNMRSNPFVLNSENGLKD